MGNVLIGPELEPLATDEQAFLLVMQLLSSESHETLLNILPEKDRARCSAVLQALYALPSSEQLPQLVGHLKRLLAFQGQSRLALVDASWVIDALHAESPWMVNILIQQFPIALAREAAKAFPHIGDKELALGGTGKPHASAIAAAVDGFEQQFAPMPFEDVTTTFHFRDLMLLLPQELNTVATSLGERMLANAFAAIGLEATARILSRYPAEVQDNIVKAIETIEVQQQLDEKTAQQFLDRILTLAGNAETLVTHAGLSTLASAFFSSELLLSKQIAQRFRKENGVTLLQYFEQMHVGDNQDSSRPGQRLQVTALVVALAQEGRIDKRFSSCKPVDA